MAGLLLLMVVALASCLPAQEERSPSLWQRDKVRDTRVDDVIQDIKMLVEEQYQKHLTEEEEVGELAQQLVRRKGQAAAGDAATSLLTRASTTTSTSTTTTSSPTTTTLATTPQPSVSSTTVSASVAESRGEELCDTIPDYGLLRNGLGQTGFLWPQGNIPYTISPGFSENETATIKSAIEYYNGEFEGCLSWVERRDENNYVTFDNSGTCSSRIGVAFFPFPVSQSIQLGRCGHLEGHVRHEMMHTIGFYHEHSRSDRDMYIEIKWENIPPVYQSQFSTYRWTTGYGETYDYESIMHYSSRAFIKDYSNKQMRSIVPRKDKVDPDNLGFKPQLSSIDKIKIRKMYKCAPYADYRAACSTEEDCGLNEYCTPLVGECRTKLPAGSLCLADRECLQTCGGGLCAECTQDAECGGEQYCAYKYLPAIENECSGYCGSLCLLSSQCGGECGLCTWGFTCHK